MNKMVYLIVKIIKSIWMNKMSFATFWVEDTFTTIPSLPGFTAAPALDWHELAEINHIPYNEVINRRNDGHRPYVARMDGRRLPMAGSPPKKYPLANSPLMLNSHPMIAISGILPPCPTGRAGGFIRVYYNPSSNRKSETPKDFGSSTRQKTSHLALA